MDIKFDYTEKDIRVISGLHHVRIRAAMYVGSVDAAGIFHMFTMIFDKALDEARAGHCTDIQVEIEADKSITVIDDGRGIPTDIHPKRNKSALEIIFTTIACGKGVNSFDGSAVVCALSKWLEVETSRKDEIGWINTYAMDFSRGEATTKLRSCDNEPETGNVINFLPDPEIFGDATIDIEQVRAYIEKAQQELPNVNIELYIE